MVLKIEPFPGRAFIQAGYPSGTWAAQKFLAMLWTLSREGSEPPRPCLVSPRGPRRASSARRECRNHSRMTLHSHAQCASYRNERKAAAASAVSIRRSTDTCHTVDHTTKNAMRALGTCDTDDLKRATSLGNGHSRTLVSRQHEQLAHSRHQPTHSHTDREAHRSHTDRLGFLQAAAHLKLIQFHAGFDTSEADSAGGITDAPQKHADCPHEHRTCTPTDALRRQIVQKTKKSGATLVSF